MQNLDLNEQIDLGKPIHYISLTCPICSANVETSFIYLFNCLCFQFYCKTFKEQNKFILYFHPVEFENSDCINFSYAGINLYCSGTSNQISNATIFSLNEMKNIYNKYKILI